MLVAVSGSSGPDLAPSQVSSTTEADGPELGSFDVQRDFLDHLSTESFETLGSRLAPDCLLLLPGIRPVSGAALVTKVLRAVRRRYDALVFETVVQFRSPDDMFVANSKVHGLRSDGMAYANDAITLIRLDRIGRIALITDYYKDTSYSAQPDRRPQPRHA